MWNAHQHSYEEIREAVVDILRQPESSPDYPRQFNGLVEQVTRVFGRREASPGRPFDPSFPSPIHPSDQELVRDVFWDLFRQGMITLGMNSGNDSWPWFRLSHFGKATIETQSPYRFHDVRSYILLVKSNVPDVSDEAVVYLEETVATFYADCFLASCVMLGVAAECEFLHLLGVAAKGPKHGKAFASLLRDGPIRPKIVGFQKALTPIVGTLQPKKDFENIDTNLTLIQSVIRIARNNAGHPTGGSAPLREQVYVLIQMFVPFAVQLHSLRRELG